MNGNVMFHSNQLHIGVTHRSYLMFEPSPQQQEIFDFVSNDTHSLIVEARAGSGKTTTLVELSKRIPSSKLSLFLAFNKNIATELQSRLPLNIQAKTFHSHCFSALQRNLPKRPKVEQDKVRWILQDSLSRSDLFRYGKFVTRLVGYAKNAGLGTDILSDEHASWFALVDHFSLQGDSEKFDEDSAIEIAQSTLRKSNDETWRIDFDDMIYLALLRNVSFDKCNFVMLDEAQDTNGVQRALVHRMLYKEFQFSIPHTETKPNDGRLIAVGDPFQSIYGFRGADVDAMKQLEEEFSCMTLPLSVSYRCSQAVVKEAQRVLA